MKKKFAFLFFTLILLSIALQQCKPDPKTCVSNCNEDDSLYIGTPDTIRKPFMFPPVVIPAGITLTKEGVLLGRMLFYDPILSPDSSTSCSSCHKQQFAFSDGGRAFSVKAGGGLTTRNAPPIFNMLWAKDFFWDGRVNTLPAQIQDALIHDQNFNAPLAISKLQAQPRYVTLFKKAFGRPGDITEEHIEKAVAQFVMKLVSTESRFDSVMRGQGTLTTEENNGFYRLFKEDPSLNIAEPGVGADCFHCHSSTAGNYLTFTDKSFHNNALSEGTNYVYSDNGLGGFNGVQLDNGRFKTPAIRNIEVTGPYMHDGRFTTLKQVVNFYNEELKNPPNADVFMKFAHQGGLKSLTEQDKNDLISFLKSLTDTKFLTDTAFSNPFR